MGPAEWIALIGLIIALVSGIGQQKLGEGSAELRSNINSLSKDIYSKIQDNTLLKEKLMTLWNEKNQRSLNALFQGMGYGPRIDVIKKQIKDDRDTYLSKVDQLNKQGQAYEQSYNALQAAASNTGTLSGNTAAAKVYSDTKKSFNDLNQNIQGGLDNA